MTREVVGSLAAVVDRLQPLRRDNNPPPRPRERADMYARINSQAAPLEPMTMS